MRVTGTRHSGNMAYSFDNELQYVTSDCAVFKCGMEDANVDASEAILATDLSTLMMYLTDPNKINYQFITDFLMTYRICIDAESVLNIILAIFDKCFEDALFNVNEEEEDEDEDEYEEGETKFNTVKKILLRTFVILRNWLLNYFIDDWVPNCNLRKHYVNFLNDLSVRISNHNEKNIVDLFFIRIVVELKKTWLGLAETYWNKRLIDQLLKANHIDSSSVTSFVINYKLDYGSAKINMSCEDLYYVVTPISRNNTLLLFSELTGDHQLKHKKSALRDNVALIKPSNSLASCPPLVLSKSKVFNNMAHITPIPSSFGTETPNRTEISKVTHNTTATSTEIKVLDVDTLEVPIHGIITGEKVEMFSSSKVNVNKSKNMPMIEEVTKSPENEKLMPLDNENVPFKSLLKKWKKRFPSKTNTELESLNFDKRLSQLVDDLTHLNNPPVEHPEYDISIEELDRIDILSARVIDELDFLKTKQDRPFDESFDASFDTGKSLFSELGLFKHGSMPQLVNGFEENELDWEDESELDASTVGKRNSFRSVADLDWNNDSLKYDSKGSSVNSDEVNSTNILDVTPSMIIDVENGYDQSHGIERYDGALSGINRFSRSSLITGGSYISYDSKLSEQLEDHKLRNNKLGEDKLDGSDNETEKSSVLFYKNNQQARFLKPKVLEKVKSFEKIRIKLERSVNDVSILKRKSLKFALGEDGKNRSGSILSKVQSKIHFFQDSLYENHSQLAVSHTAPHLETTNKYHAVSVSTRKSSTVQNSIFSENGTLNTVTTSEPLSSYEELTKNMSEQSHHNVLRSKPSVGNIKAFINRNTITESDVESDHSLLEYPQVPGTSGDAESIRTTTNRYDWPLSGSMRRDKSDISMLSVGSYQMPGINPEIIQTLAAIPDESFHGEDPVSATLLRLEGKLGHDTDTESLKRKVPARKDFPLVPKQLREKHERKICQPKKHYNKPVEKTIEEQVADLNICDSLPEAPQELVRPFSSKFFQAYSSQNIFDSAPDCIKKQTDKDPRKVLKNYKPTHNLLSVNKVMADQAHVPFILGFASKDIAQQLTLIERDALLEIDWKELVELCQNDFTTRINNLKYSSWTEVLIQKHLKGIDIAISRFNLMVSWIISEILLSNNLRYRLMTILKFIEIAQQCHSLQNYSTMMQIILALSSEKISNLPNTWEQLDGNVVESFKQLEELADPVSKFAKLKLLNENAVASIGCIPFIGLYISDLQTNSQKPNFIRPHDANKVAALQVKSPEAHIVINNPPKSLAGGNSLLYWEKFFSISRVIKSLVQKVQYSKYYNIEPSPDLLSKCLYIKSLAEDEMDVCALKMIDP